jgi:hypothetical protein
MKTKKVLFAAATVAASALLLAAYTHRAQLGRRSIATTSRGW